MKQIKTQARDRSQATCWDILKKQAFDFCRQTGLHGYQYIGWTQRSKTERIVWAIMMTISFCCANVLITTSWEYYAAHPTMTVIESTHHGIWNYPFPAITICNMNRISHNLTKKFVNGLKIPSNISKEYLVQQMQLMNELLYPGMNGHDLHKNLTDLQHIIDDNKLSIFDAVDAITQDCNDLLVMCKWKGTLESCEKLFKRSVSRDGFCCSFNYYSSPNSVGLDNIDESAACGLQTGLTAIINVESDDYHAAATGSYGVKMMIHYPYNYPDFNSEFQLTQPTTQYFMGIDPLKMHAKKEVRDLAISTRKCIFSDEADKELYTKGRGRNLTVTKYTYHNCLAECRAGIAKVKCGCIPYYFPQTDTRVCNLTDVKCLKKYEWFFETSWPEMTDINRTLSRNDTYQTLPLNKIKKYPCGCIPDCELYMYPIQSSYATLNSNVYYSNGSFSKSSRNGRTLVNHTIVHVFFNDLVAFLYRRSVNYSWPNLFATFGGLLGLFAGFSLISIFEILYFFVIRVIIDACINSRKQNNIQ